MTEYSFGTALETGMQRQDKALQQPANCLL